MTQAIVRMGQAVVRTRVRVSEAKHQAVVRQRVKQLRGSDSVRFRVSPL